MIVGSLRPATGLPRLLLLLVLLSVLPACGVAFTDDWDGTELFRGMKLDGERNVNSELTLTIWLRPGYPVPVHIACVYERDRELTDDEEKLTFHERATQIGEATLTPAPGKRPNDKSIELEPYSFTFSVHEPGKYFLACLTPAAADNGLGMSFTIRETREPIGASN